MRDDDEECEKKLWWEEREIFIRERIGEAEGRKGLEKFNEVK